MEDKLLKILLDKINKIKNIVKESCNKECFYEIEEIINRLSYKENLIIQLQKTGIKIFIFTDSSSEKKYMIKELSEIFSLTSSEISGIEHNNSLTTNFNEIPVNLFFLESFQNIDKYADLVIIISDIEDSGLYKIVENYKTPDKKIEIIHNLQFLESKKNNNTKSIYYNKITGKLIENKIREIAIGKMQRLLYAIKVSKEIALINNTIKKTKEKKEKVKNIKNIKDEIENWISKFINKSSYEYSYKILSNPQNEWENLISESNKINEKELVEFLKKKEKETKNILGKDCLFRKIRVKKTSNIDFSKIEPNYVNLRITKLFLNFKTYLKIMMKSLTIENIILLAILFATIYILKSINRFPLHLVRDLIRRITIFSIIANVTILFLINIGKIQSEIKINKLERFKEFHENTLKKNSKAYFSTQIYNSLEDEEIYENYEKITRKMKNVMNKKIKNLSYIKEALVDLEKEINNKINILRRERIKWEEILEFQKKS